MPHVERAFDEWLAVWQAWADRERDDAVARDLYKDLFAIYLKSTDHSEEFELVVGVGCLSWRPDDHEQVSGTSRRRRSRSPSTRTRAHSRPSSAVAAVGVIELDMLDPSLVSSPAAIDEIRDAAGEYSAHVLDVPAIGDICRRLIFRLDPDAVYDDVLERTDRHEPRGAFAPALILRRRTNRGLVQIYEQIVAQILASNEVPTGVLPLIDPDQQPESEPSDDSGRGRHHRRRRLPSPASQRAAARVIDRVDASRSNGGARPAGNGQDAHRGCTGLASARAG